MGWRIPVNEPGLLQAELDEQTGELSQTTRDLVAKVYEIVRKKPSALTEPSRQESVRSKSTS